ncbi:MAG: hypothetical protein GX630_02080 [Actinobacteria bacterium]|nr:hypothetical protein [Actinomycetota bacterium]
MSIVSSRKPRFIGATASYLNAGLWGSRFVGDCEVATNGEQVWLKGRRIPVWMVWARVLSFVGFFPVGFYAGFLVADTMQGHRGYPPYYYLAAALLTFLLVVIGMWGSGIWHQKVGEYEAVSWPVSAARAIKRPDDKKAIRRRAIWLFLNTFVNMNHLIQVEVPIGRGGKPRRLILSARNTEKSSLTSVLSGAYYGQGKMSPLMFEMPDNPDPWGWGRN